MPYIGTSPSQGVRRVHTYTATASQTTFSGAGAEGTSLSYKDSNYVDVYQNGIKLGDADYTSTSGTSIVLAQGASVDDIVVVVVFDVFSVADTVSKADGGTFDGNVTMAGTLGVTGASTLTGALSAKGGAVFNEDSADVDFRVESNGNANMLFVDGGNDIVGIGVVPTAQFSHNIIQIGSQASLGANGALTTTGQTYLTHNLYFNTDGNYRVFNTSSANEGAILQMGDGILKFSNSSATTGTPTVTERMRIDSSGSVAIGSTSTSGADRLTLKGSTTDSSTNLLVRNSADTTLLVLANDKTFNVQGVYDQTTSSGANVNVASDGHIRRSTSSLRYKNTVSNAAHGLTELLTLRPVTYKGNNDGDTVFGGLIAEEVHDAGLTEFVQYDDDGQPDALAYGNMVSLCIKAIQELKTELDEAKARITALENAE
jgi:hypothetical protein